VCLQWRQDVQYHWLENWMALWPGTAGRSRTHRQAIPHIRQRWAVPAGDRVGTRVARLVLPRLRCRLAGQTRSSAARLTQGRVHGIPNQWHLLRDRGYPAAARRRRWHRVLPRATEALWRRRDSQRGLLRQQARRSSPRALRFL
jgi:hypothetical protein